MGGKKGPKHFTGIYPWGAGGSGHEHLPSWCHGGGSCPGRIGEERSIRKGAAGREGGRGVSGVQGGKVVG